jgi:hypothetical protein
LDCIDDASRTAENTSYIGGYHDVEFRRGAGPRHPQRGSEIMEYFVSGLDRAAGEAMPSTG